MLKRAVFHLARRCGAHLLSRQYISTRRYHRVLAVHDEQKIMSQRRYKALTRDLQMIIRDPDSMLSFIKLLDSAKTYVVDVSLGKHGICFAVFDTTARLDGRVGYHPPRGEKVRGRFRFQILDGQVYRASLQNTHEYVTGTPLFVRSHTGTSWV